MQPKYFVYSTTNKERLIFAGSDLFEALAKGFAFCKMPLEPETFKTVMDHFKNKKTDELHFSGNGQAIKLVMER